MVDRDAFQEEILNRFIRVKEGLDILRWGDADKGTFSIKEANNIRMGNLGWKECQILGGFLEPAPASRRYSKMGPYTGKRHGGW